MSDFSFPKTRRLLSRNDFRNVAENGSRIAGKFIFIELLKNNLRNTRLGISASKKYGPSVARNRFKRLVREAFRLNQHLIPAGWDIIVKPRGVAKELSLKEISEDLLNLL